MSQYQSSNNASDRKPRWVAYTATADFWGDSRASQISFRKNARVDVDVHQYPQNGWRWGKSGDRTGWFPEWAAEENSLSRSSHQRNSGRSRDRITPMMEKISEKKPGDGVDRRNKSTKSIRNKSTKSNKSSATDCSKSPRQPRFSRRHSTGGPEGLLSWREKLSSMTAVRSTQKGPEWDGSELPQVVNEDGSIAVIESDGKNTSYRNERSYKSAEAVNRMAEITGITGIRMPKSYSMHNSFSSRSTRSISTGSFGSTGSNGSTNTGNATFGSPLQQKPVKKQLFGKFRRRGSSHTALNIMN